MREVLITGATGMIGRVLMRRPGDTYSVRGLISDRRKGLR